MTYRKSVAAVLVSAFVVLGSAINVKLDQRRLDAAAKRMEIKTDKFIEFYREKNSIAPNATHQMSKPPVAGGQEDRQVLMKASLEADK